MSAAYVEVTMVTGARVSVYVWGNAALPDFGARWDSDGWNGESGLGCEERMSAPVAAGELGAAQKRYARRLRDGRATALDRERLDRAILGVLSRGAS